MPEAKVLPRKIRWKGSTLADLNPQAPIHEVLKMHAVTIPELATATLEGPKTEKDALVYTAQERLGTKG